MPGSLADLWVDVSLDIRPAMRDLDKLHKKLASVATSFKKFSSMKANSSIRFSGGGGGGMPGGGIGMGQLAGAFGGYIGARALGGIAKDIVKTQMTFEQSMSRVAAISGSTGQELDALTVVAKKMGAETVYTASQAADAMGFFALAGFKTNEIIAAMPATLGLASAGQIDIAQAADIAAKAMRGMAIPATEMPRIADVMARAFTTANTDLVQLGEALKYVGPVAHSSGKGLEETVAALQVLSDSGIQASMAGTGLRRVLSALAGKGESRKELEKLGFTAEELESNFNSLPQAIDAFNQKLGSMSEMERMASLMGVFGERGGPAMAVLLEKGGNALRDYEARLVAAAGTAEKIAAKQLDNLAGSVTVLSSAWENLAITLGEKTNPALRAIVQGLTDMANEADEAIKKGPGLTDLLKLAEAVILPGMAVGRRAGEHMRRNAPGGEDWTQARMKEYGGLKRGYNTAISNEQAIRMEREALGAAYKKAKTPEEAATIDKKLAENSVKGMRAAEELANAFDKLLSVEDELIRNFALPMSAQTDVGESRVSRRERVNEWQRLMKQDAVRAEMTSAMAEGNTKAKQDAFKGLLAGAGINLDLLKQAAGEGKHGNAAMMADALGIDELVKEAGKKFWGAIGDIGNMIGMPLATILDPNEKSDKEKKKGNDKKESDQRSRSMALEEMRNSLQEGLTGKDKKKEEKKIENNTKRTADEVKETKDALKAFLRKFTGAATAG